MGETVEFSITRASQLTIPNKDWTHYRLGLKIRCSSGSLGVTLGVISQGKSIDTTMITASNVRFLSKEPIVGLKIFDGEKLRKRLQITFTSEGNFNMFANKINQWLGLLVVDKYTCTDLQLPNSQAETQCTSFSQPHNVSLSQVEAAPSQVIGSQQRSSQIFGSRSAIPQRAVSVAPTSQVSCSQENFSQFVPLHDLSQQLNSASVSQLFCQDDGIQDPQNSKIDQQNHNFDAILMLVNAANFNNSKQFPLYDTSALSQSTSIWNDDSKTSLLQYPTSSNNTSFTQIYDTKNSLQGSLGISKPTTSIPDLTNTLRSIPFNPSQGKKKARSSRTKKTHAMEDLLETTINRILEEKQESFADLNDEDLSLKIGRKLKSKSFLALLKRVESLLE